jgi:hypothetical protein
MVAQLVGAGVVLVILVPHPEGGGLRSGPLPSAAIDGAGTVWVVWEDCRFRANCLTNDLVYSTSTDGKHWSKVTRIDPRRHHCYRPFHSRHWH